MSTNKQPPNARDFADKVAPHSFNNQVLQANETLKQSGQIINRILTQVQELVQSAQQQLNTMEEASSLGEMDDNEAPNPNADILNSEKNVSETESRIQQYIGQINSLVEQQGQHIAQQNELNANQLTQQQQQIAESVNSSLEDPSQGG